MSIYIQEQCLKVLESFKVDHKTQDHCIAVSELAKEIAGDLKNAGHHLDIDLTEAGALLHDVARKEKEHALCGAKWLRELGYYRVAEVVESHMDLPEDAIEMLDERAVVYLADKLIIGSRRVTLKERFERSIIIFKDDKPAMDAANIRFNNAKRVLQNIVEKTGGMAIYENSFGA